MCAQRRRTDPFAPQNPGPNPHTLYGALVGGPKGDDSYEDNRNNFIQNEVAVDYNAGFTGGWR